MWLAELARDRGLETPERVAYRWLDRNLEPVGALTYAELDRRASAIGAGIASRTASGARVLLVLPSGLDFVVALFACMYASRTVVPALEPRRRDVPAQSRLRALLGDASPELVIARAEFAAELERPPWSMTVPKGTSCATLEQLDAAAHSGAVPARDANEITLLQYTSGSTRRPLGAMITEAALRANLEQIARRFEHTPASHGVIWLPMHHDMGLIGGVLEPMHSGFTTTLMSPLDFAGQPIRWLRAISRCAGTTSGGPAFAYRMCVERIREGLEDLDLSSWQVAFVGAERVSAPILRSFTARFAASGFRESALLPCYGLAESTLMATSRAKGSGLSTSPGPAQHVSCGAPIAGHDLCVVDADSGKSCCAGEIGEVWVRGPSVAAGYWRNPEVTASTFEAKLEGAGAYMRTGDLGFLRDGELFVTGRLKETIVVRGVKHVPEDLEATVVASHPCFARAPVAAFACDSEEGESLIIACEVRPIAWSELDFEAARSAALEAVVRAHDVRPRAIVLVKRGSIPHTTSGKVQRTLCRTLFERGGLLAEHGSAS